MGDITGGGFGAINIEDKNGMAYGLKREFLFFGPCLVDEDYVCTIVQQGIHENEGLFVLRGNKDV